MTERIRSQRKSKAALWGEEGGCELPLEFWDGETGRTTRIYPGGKQETFKIVRVKGFRPHVTYFDDTVSGKGARTETLF